jgi:hypothetical protein
MTATIGMGAVREFDYTRVQVPLVVLRVLTEGQVERLGILIAGYNAETAELSTDSWNPDSVLFTLFDAQKRPMLHGLIEPGGSAHT